MCSDRDEKKGKAPTSNATIAVTIISLKFMDSSLYLQDFAIQFITFPIDFVNCPVCSRVCHFGRKIHP